MSVDFSVPDHPHFDPESTPYFLERLASASEYLEYGSGGSTVEAARHGVKFTTVESDPAFLNAVRAKIGPDKGTLIHVDIGQTEDWGVPVHKRRWPWKRNKWSKYATAPWERNIAPDLVLIDGRFRVHCALSTIVRSGGRDYEILFDDYVGRDFYHEVARFAQLKYCKGRMACFTPRKFDADAMNAALRHYAMDWR